MVLWLGLGGWAAQAQMRVSQIIITNVGPAATSDAMVRANLRTKVGEVYNRSATDDDINNLKNTGLFLNVQVTEERTDEGIIVKYLLLGRPKISDIAFKGNTKYKEKKLRKKITSKEGQPMDERKLFLDAQEIKKMYQQAGYPGTEVNYKPEVNEKTGKAYIVFEIQESPKIIISDVIFDGAKAFSQRELRKQIKTRRHWMFSWLTGSGVKKDDQLDEDKEQLAEFYRNKGYIDFELKDVKEVQVSARKVVLHFIISEGRQYRVGAVAFKGNTLFTTNQLSRKLKMGVGTIFTPKGQAKDLEAIDDTYGAKGYIDAKVLPHRNANTQTGTMDLVYEIEEKDQSIIEKVEIRGNVKTKDRVIRRELSVAPGEVFDMTKVKKSKQRLEGTALFERVEAEPESTDVPNHKNLVVTVNETTTAHVSFGAGFSSVDSILGFVEYRESNFQLPWFRGGGQKFRLRATVGALTRDYEMGFVEPWFLNKKLELSVDAYHRELYNLSLDNLYNLSRTGARIGVRRAFTDYLIGGIGYTIENVGIFDVSSNAPSTVKAQAGDTLISKFGPTLTYDTRRYESEYSGFLPVGGQMTDLRTEVAGPFGGDTDYYKLELATAWYFKGLAKGHILEAGGRVGTVKSYGRSTTVPFFDQFYLGGMDTLRGFRYRQVGPVELGSDGTFERIGGNTYWFGSAEYSVPIIDFLRFAVFYDVGMVYADSWSFDTKNNKTGFYNDDWGVGIRLNIPRIGPLRLDYGIPIKSDPLNGGSGRFNFSVGYTRDF